MLTSHATAVVLWQAAHYNGALIDGYGRISALGCSRPARAASPRRREMQLMGVQE